MFLENNTKSPLSSASAAPSYLSPVLSKAAQATLGLCLVWLE